LVAAAAALDDDDFIARSYALNQLGMRQIVQGVLLLGLDYIPSYGNFVAVRVGDGANRYQQLLRHGVIVRPVGNYGLPEYLRVSIGLAAENTQFLQALESVIEEIA
jgi:histidinol-phosphate aminotransferase